MGGSLLFSITQTPPLFCMNINFEMMKRQTESGPSTAQRIALGIMQDGEREGGREERREEEWRELRMKEDREGGKKGGRMKGEKDEGRQG